MLARLAENLLAVSGNWVSIDCTAEQQGTENSDHHDAGTQDTGYLDMLEPYHQWIQGVCKEDSQHQ
jgi:hypothetical protein